MEAGASPCAAKAKQLGFESKQIGAAGSDTENQPADAGTQGVERSARCCLGMAVREVGRACNGKTGHQRRAAARWILMC